MKHSFVRILFVIVVLHFSTHTFAQQFKSITTKHGLSSNEAIEIVQDSTGFMWFATKKGLNRYNGYTIKTYYSNPNDTTTIANNSIHTLLYTTTSKLLIGTRNGLSIYNPEFDNFTTYRLKTEQNPYSIPNYINQIIEDDKGQIWIATSTGLYQFSLTTKKYTPYFNYRLFVHFNNDDISDLLKKGVPKYVLNKLEEINNQFFTSAKILLDKLYRLLGEIDHKQYSTTILEHIKEKQAPFFPASVNTLTTEGSKLWLGLSNGHLVKFSPENKEIQLAYIEDNIDIEANIISILINKQDIWFGSTRSAKIFDKKEWQLRTALTEAEQKLINKREPKFFHSNDNKIWVCSTSGLTLFDPATDQTEHHSNQSTNPNSLTANFTKHIYTDKQNQLWIATHGGGICKQKSFKQFHNIYRGNQYNVSSMRNKISSILIDDKEQIWVGYYTGGIVVYDKHGEKLQSFNYTRNKPHQQGEIGIGTITGLVQDKNGTIWVSSYFTGLQYFDKDNNKFVDFKIEKSNENQKRKTHIVQLSVTNCTI